MWPLLRHRRSKAAMLLYPLLTLTCIIVTANHYWLDGIGGLITLLVGFVFGWALHVWNQRRLDRKFEAALDAQGVLVTPADTPSEASTSPAEPADAP
jgi:hypothetical protein